MHVLKSCEQMFPALATNHLHPEALLSPVIDGQKPTSFDSSTCSLALISGPFVFEASIKEHCSGCDLCKRFNSLPVHAQNGGGSFSTYSIESQKNHFVGRWWIMLDLWVCDVRIPWDIFDVAVFQRCAEKRLRFKTLRRSHFEQFRRQFQSQNQKEVRR